jgi:filamentous hemagglutinin
LKQRAPAPKSFNLLNVPDNIVAALKPGTFWDTYNKPFLDAAIQRGDDIVVATKPELRFLKRTDGSLTGFGREMQYLESKGFLYDSVTGFMRKRGGQ